MKGYASFLSVISIGALVLPAARGTEWDQATNPQFQPSFPNGYRPQFQNEPLPPVSSTDSQIRSILRETGLSSDRINRLQRDQFDYGRVQETVEDALVIEGQGRENARMRAAQVAQEIHRLKSGASTSQRLGPPTAEKVFPSDGWRTQEIREKLEQVGLPDSVMDVLEREHFPPFQVEQKVRESLLDRGYPEDSAELRARNLTNQIRTIVRGMGQAPAYQQQSGTGRSVDRSQIREWLRQAGLSARQVDRLDRRGYPADQVRILVEDRLEEQGFPAAEAERQAQQLATQIQP